MSLPIVKIEQYAKYEEPERLFKNLEDGKVELRIVKNIKNVAYSNPNKVKVELCDICIYNPISETYHKLGLKTFNDPILLPRSIMKLEKRMNQEYDNSKKCVSVMIPLLENTYLTKVIMKAYALIEETKSKNKSYMRKKLTPKFVESKVEMEYITQKLSDSELATVEEVPKINFFTQEEETIKTATVNSIYFKIGIQSKTKDGTPVENSNPDAKFNCTFQKITKTGKECKSVINNGNIHKELLSGSDVMFKFALSSLCITGGYFAWQMYINKIVYIKKDRKGSGGFKEQFNLSACKNNGIAPDDEKDEENNSEEASDNEKNDELENELDQLVLDD